MEAVQTRRVFRVLLVEDDPVARALAKQQLRSGGHIVLAVDGFEAALASIATLGCPDVAVVDIDLPGRDGLDLLIELRTHTCPEAPGAVVLSAEGPPSTDQYQIDKCDRYLAKPVSAQQLLTAVESVYRASHTDANLSAARHCRATV